MTGVPPARLDAHSHVYPASYMSAMRAAGHPLPLPERFSDLAAKLAFMDELAIERALVSLGNPWLDPLGERGDELARELNAELAGLAAASGGRLLALGVLAQGSVAEAAATVAEVAAEPRLYGVVSGTRVCGLVLDDRRLDPLWSALGRTGLPLLLHPHYGTPDLEGAAGGLEMRFGLGFPLETAAALGRLLYAGVLERHPGLRIVAAHAGGALPAVIGRMQAFWETRPEAEGEGAAPAALRASAAELAFDGLGYAPAAVRAALDLVGPERVFFGTDHPFPVAASRANEAALERALAAEEAALVYGAAAAAFFGLPE